MQELGTAVAVVRPFRFDSVQHVLMVCPALTVTYTFSAGSQLLPAGGSALRYSAYSHALANFGYLGIHQDFAPPRLKYLILLGEDVQALKDAVEPLRVWKWLQGHDAQVWCVGSQVQRTQHAIRQLIASSYNPASTTSSCSSSATRA